jgi:glycosyltransferase involved in cell wall biosynthesis
MPVYNAEDTIVGTLESIWSQTFEDFEVVVVDDCSTDATPELLADQTDPRLRILRNPENRRVAATFNRTVEHARASLIKFHESDDKFYPDCIAKMIELADEQPEVGMIFCRRDMLFDPANPLQRSWVEQFGDVASRLGELHSLNDGRELFRRWMDVGFDFNCVGEPMVVMLRREILERAGGFNTHIRQRCDLDLWARAMVFCQVGFIPEALGEYRVPTMSLTTRNYALRLDWLDELWTLEGLTVHPEALEAAPGLDRLHREVRLRKRHEFRNLLRRGDVPGQKQRLTDAGRMALWLLRRRLQPSSLPFAEVSPLNSGVAQS